MEASRGPLSAGLRRRLLFGGLYFSEGAPIGFIWWALPVWLRTDGVSPGDIARLSALATWPWTLKFLLAPAVDLLRGPRFGLRGWILTSQALMALSLLPLALLGLPDPRALAVLLVSHALAAATQDTSIDTFAVRSIPAAERGALNGWMQVGMLGARALFGGGAVLLAVHLGQRAVVALLIAAISGPALLAAGFVRDEPGSADPARGDRRERLRRFRSGLARMVRRRALWIGLVFTTLAGAGFEGLTSVGSALLLDRGASESQVGSFFLVPAVALMACGALAGGRASDRFGRRRVTALGEGAAALATVAVGLLVRGDASGGLAPLFALMALLYLAAGAATAGLYAMLMDLCDADVAATQFCTFMAAVNLCMVWSAAAMGGLYDLHGYGPAAVTLGCVSLLALPLLLALPARGGAHGREPDTYPGR